ncbi:MAG: hypothetical protein M1814_005471 [Vezdaea aestivalis]|nr:MAG: hypothetical protein M1814_005471 [Vezdaea aestivalis]
MSGMAGAQAPKYRFYITRSDGTNVPLIPADELPTSIVVPGIPRTLSEAEMRGMVSLGSPQTHQLNSSAAVENSLLVDLSSPEIPAVSRPQLMYPTNTFLLRTGGDATMDQFDGFPVRAPNPTLQDSSEHTAKIDPKVVTEAPEPKLVLQVSQKVITKATSSNARTCPVAPPGICHYWIRTGECDFSQKDGGCVYSHTMPTTLEGLHALGKRDWPAWWKRINPHYSDYCWSWVRFGYCEWTRKNPDTPCHHFHQMPRYLQEFRRGGLFDAPKWYCAMYPKFKAIKDVPQG